MRRLPVLRAASEPVGATNDVMTVQFSVFDTWYEIDSWWEGQFMERTARGAFSKTIAERGDSVKVLFNHGFDFSIGDKVLGVPELLEERKAGPYAEVPLLDTSYNRDLIPGLRAGAYGSSFMFEVIRDSWNREPDPSDANPDGLPERTIQEVRLYEFGPVTWPANPAATAGMRSMTDWYGERLADRDPDRRAALAARYDDFRASHGLRTSAPTRGADAAKPTAAPAGIAESPRGLSPAARARRLVLLDFTRGRVNG